MQTSKIVVGELYAIKRGANHERFNVTEIVTKKTTSGTTSVIFGHVIDDGGTRGAKLEYDPKDIEGPYTVVAELVAKQEREKAERERQSAERHEQALADRRTLYKFVGVKPTKNVKDYDQPFSVSYGDVEIRAEGKRLLLEKIRSIQPNDLNVVKYDPEDSFSDRSWRP